MWRITLMAGKWYANAYDDAELECESINTLVSNGNIVCLCDDLERFCSEMNLNIHAIIMMDDEA